MIKAQSLIHDPNKLVAFEITMMDMDSYKWVESRYFKTRKEAMEFRAQNRPEAKPHAP